MPISSLLQIALEDSSDNLWLTCGSLLERKGSTVFDTEFVLLENCEPYDTLSIYVPHSDIFDRRRIFQPGHILFIVSWDLQNVVDAWFDRGQGYDFEKRTLWTPEVDKQFRIER